MNAPKAEMAGTKDVKIFVLAIPKAFIELIKRMKAKHEHRAARNSSGFKVLILRLLKLKSPESTKRNKGRK